MKEMRIGVVTHLFWGHKILLVLRDNKPGICCPNAWDSVTETLEPEESLYECILRGLTEELCVVPNHLSLLGTTRAGHGFSVGFLRERERRRINIKPGGEGQAHNFFTLDEARELYLGGAVKNHLEVYPQAFDKMARGVMPRPEELGLKPIEA